MVALRLEADLQRRRLDERDCDASWPGVMRDLSQVQASTWTAPGASGPPRARRPRVRCRRRQAPVVRHSSRPGPAKQPGEGAKVQPYVPKTLVG